MELRTPPVPNGEVSSIRIALVDDHPLFREGVFEILQFEEDIEVVAEAGDSTAAVAAIGETRPDIVLLDVEIPGDDVAVTLRRMRAASPETKTIILSMHDGGALVQRLLGLGVQGYLHKSVSRLGLLAAIRSIQANDSHIVVSVSPASLVPSREEIAALSEREREVLHLVAHAMSNAQIANRLGLTEATVKRHLRNIFVKLSAVSRLDAVNKAVAAALIEPALPVDGPSVVRRPESTPRSQLLPPS